MEETLGRIQQIWRHPVKSLLGEEIGETVVTQRGVLGDRGYVLFDPQKKKVASAKDPRQWPNMFGFRAAYSSCPSEQGSLPAVEVTLPSGETLRSTDRDFDQRISGVIGRDVTLVSTPFTEATADGYWPDDEWVATRNQSFEYQFPEGTFFDGAMVHLITTSTLECLTSRYPASQFSPHRFRANFLIETNPVGSGFVENSWIGRSIMLGSTRLQIERPCPRCVMTTLAQSDLPKDPAILKAAVRENAGNVGVYAKVESGGRVKQGDEVRFAT
jgi:uncharacterized protein YcbX